jgi:hypothetical protein
VNAYTEVCCADEYFCTWYCYLAKDGCRVVSLNLLGAGTRVITNALAPGGGSPLHSGGLKPATIPNRARSDAQFLPVGRSSDHPLHSIKHKHTTPHHITYITHSINKTVTQALHTRLSQSQPKSIAKPHMTRRHCVPLYRCIIAMKPNRNQASKTLTISSIHPRT